jgi:nucleotide-binding universal stress UspA family protein
LFRSKLAESKIPGSWEAHEMSAGFSMPRRARCADLTVVGQHDPEDPEGYVAGRYPEDTVLGAGGPVLVVPFDGGFIPPDCDAVVAWDGSREAARAAHDALPLLRFARQVRIVSAIDPGAKACVAHSPPADLATLLAGHGVRAEPVELKVTGTAQVASRLLFYTQECSAKLLVMGAYGHGHLRESMLGGVTRTVLRAMKVPVLMSC